MDETENRAEIVLIVEGNKVSIPYELLSGISSKGLDYTYVSRPSLVEAILKNNYDFGFAYIIFYVSRNDLEEISSLPISRTKMRDTKAVIVSLNSSEINEGIFEKIPTDWVVCAREDVLSLISQKKG